MHAPGAATTAVGRPIVNFGIISHRILGLSQATAIHVRDDDADDAAQVARELVTHEPGSLLNPPIAVINGSPERRNPRNGALPDPSHSPQAFAGDSQPAWVFASTQAPEEFSLDDL